MSRRRNKTLKAGALIGCNPHDWGNGKGRKRPKEYRTKKDPLLLEQQEDQSHKK